MNFLTLGLFSLWACGDKPVTTDTATSQPSSEPASSPTDDPIIEEELEPLEVVAVGFEFLGSWDQNNAELGGWTLDDGTPRDGVVLVHFTNMDFFSEGAGDDDENICTLNALFVNQAAVLDAQEYPWDNPPSNSGMYPLDGTAVSTWAGFEGYLTFDGTTATPDSCGRILDDRVITVTDEGNIVFPMDGMHFGISYGALTEEHESRLSEAYTDSEIGDYFDTYKEAFVSQFIHINHPDASSDEGYDFTGYDWNYARLAGLNEDETLSVVPCEWDETLECYDLIPYDGAQNVFSVSDAFWYEDFPNIDFDILQLGVPDMTEEPILTAAEEFCALFTDTCGSWGGSATCEDWYNAADAGTEGDATGASQACYDYHLDVASQQTDQAAIDMHCAHATGVADVDGNAPCAPTAAEEFCALFTDTCGSWGGSATCEDWYNAADAGTEGDATGASQACYDYHLDVASQQTDQAAIDMHCAHATGVADVDGNAPCQ